jgi:hypothetical protein
VISSPQVPRGSRRGALSPPTQRILLQDARMRAVVTARLTRGREQLRRCKVHRLVWSERIQPWLRPDTNRRPCGADRCWIACGMCTLHVGGCPAQREAVNPSPSLAPQNASALKDGVLATLALATNTARTMKAHRLRRTNPAGSLNQAGKIDSPACVDGALLGIRVWCSR